MSPADKGASDATSQGRLDSWKEIAAYLGRSVRCVQQWEAEYGLPVHRLTYDKKASVYAYKEALDAWRVEREKNLDAPAPPVPEHKPARRNLRAVPIAAAVLVVIVAAVVWLSFVRGRTGEKRVRVRPLAIAAGTEMMAAFSPDGNRVAYVWDGAQEEDAQAISANIFIKQLDADRTVQLTRGQLDYFPQWSPDGKLISFYRAPELLAIPAIGGRELKLGDVRWGRIGPIHTWTADSSGVISADRAYTGATSPLWFLPLDMGRKVQVTEPPVGFADLTPAMSPDGRTLAFTRNSASLANNIFLLPIDGHRPLGPPRQLTFSESTTYFYLTWAEDGQSLFCLRSRPNAAVLRIPVHDQAGAEVVPQILPNLTNFLAAAPRGNKLAWSTAIYDMDLWRSELVTQAGIHSNAHARVAHTTRPEHEPGLSPDGSMLAFMSSRGGTTQLWLSDADGDNPIVFDSRKAHNPHWSPDGREIAYEVYDRGGVDIYVKPVRYGASRLVTEAPSEALRPVWSRNGRWIYFSSDRSGIRNIWKVPAKGGQMVRVTESGGFRAAESLDGRTLYFTKEELDTTLWEMPVNGGNATRILAPLPSGDAFQVFKDGIYTVMKDEPSGGPALVFYTFGSRQTRTVATLDRRFHSSISMSADARWLVYDALRYRSGDLMMIEGLQ